MRTTKKSSQKVLRMMIRSRMPSPLEYLTTFSGMPAHYRKSVLGEMANNQSKEYSISSWLKPRFDNTGVQFINVKLDPKTKKLKEVLYSNLCSNYVCTFTFFFLCVLKPMFCRLEILSIVVGFQSMIALGYHCRHKNYKIEL